MTNILVFGAELPQPIAITASGTLAAGLTAMRSDLSLVQAHLRQAEQLAAKAASHLGDSYNSLLRAKAFCTQCQDAIDLNDLDRMIAARDALAAALATQAPTLARTQASTELAA